MSDILDRAYDQYAASSNNEYFNHKSLLEDPTLVENYEDIISNLPKKLENEEELNSVNGSVVITSQQIEKLGISPVRLSMLSNSSSHYSIRNEDYEYSDSDFEDNLEKRVKQMEDDSLKRRLYAQNFVDDANNAINNDEIQNGNTSFAPNQNEGNDEDFQPSYPPKELDPGKLYALYPFQGPDPSHCQLDQDQSCILLNDQDSYWWLVKRCNDDRIGFAPAEILETFPERLARLNCWKNENISSQSLPKIGSKDVLENDKDLSIEDDSNDSNTKSFDKGNKSVSFNDVVSYAERYIQDINDENSKDDSISIDKILETTLNDRIYDNDKDNISETISDSGFDTDEIASLDVKKTRSNEKEIDTKRNCQLSKDKDNDGLHQIFRAPVMPIVYGNNKELRDSTYSLSTIGEYSPSSSDWTNDSPQIDQQPFDVSPSHELTIPTSDTQEISKLSSSNTFVPSLDTKLIGEDADTVITARQATNHLQRESYSTSSEDSYMDTKIKDDPIAASLTTLNIGNSFLNSPVPKKNHPLIFDIYNPIFGKIEDLIKKLDKISVGEYE